MSSERPMPEKFRLAVEKVLEHEGGYVNDPDDPGGETNFGISKRAHPDVNIRGLTEEKARRIYFEKYWEPYKYDRIENFEVAAKIFDLAVNMGPGTANVMLQLAVNRSSDVTLKIDGLVGPRTIEAVNEHPSARLLLCTLKLLAVEAYADINKPRFLKGWVKRALS